MCVIGEQSGGCRCECKKDMMGLMEQSVVVVFFFFFSFKKQSINSSSIVMFYSWDIALCFSV